MKITRITTALIVLFIALGASAPVMAQSEADAIAAIRAQIGANRQALVAENMMFTEAESEKFWPLYREFQAERSALMDRRVAILTNFRDNYETLTNEQAKSIIDEALKLEEDLFKLRRNNTRRFRKVISDKQVLRYFQIESKLDAIINFDLARVVPLAE